MTALTTCQCLISGKWADAHTDRFADVFNPSTGETIAHENGRRA